MEMRVAKGRRRRREVEQRGKKKVQLEKERERVKERGERERERERQQKLSPSGPYFSLLSRPNRQRTLNKLPTELRCRNFCY